MGSLQKPQSKAWSFFRSLSVFFWLLLCPVLTTRRNERRTRREKRRRDAKRRKMTMEEIGIMEVDVGFNTTQCRRLSTRPAAPTPTRHSAVPPTRQFVTRFPRPQSRTSAPSSTSRSQASPSALTRSKRCAVLSVVTNKSATRITANRAAASPLVPPKWWRVVLQCNRLLTDRSATRVHRRCATRSHQRPVTSTQLLSTSKSQEGYATDSLESTFFPIAILLLNALDSSSFAR